jgi:hypothetical protein
MKTIKQIKERIELLAIQIKKINATKPYNREEYHDKLFEMHHLCWVLDLDEANFF